MKPENVSFEQLVAYVSGELTGREATTVEACLAVLPAVARTTQRLAEVIQRLRADDTPHAPPDAVRRVLNLPQSLEEVSAPDWLAPVRLFAKLVFDSRAPLAMAGYRGGAASYQLAFDSETARVDLQILPQEGAVGDRWRVRGQITVRDDAELGAVTLMAEHTDTTVATAVPDQAGHFKIDSPPGVFDLRIDFDEGTRSVVAPRLEVGPDFA